jgi:hypothetical protein
VLPRDIVDRNGRPILQHTLQRCWNRARAEKYAYLDSKHVYVRDGRNVCNKYKLDREKIIEDFGATIFEAGEPWRPSDSWSALVAERLEPEMYVNGHDMDVGIGEKNFYDLTPLKDAINRLDPTRFYTVPKELLNSVNAAIEHRSSRLSWSVNVKEKRGGRMVIAGRMTSGNCSIRKKERERLCPHLFEKTAREYDIKSTVPAVVRLLRTGEWLRPGENLRMEVLLRSGLRMSEKRFKPLILHMLFNQSCAMAWATFNYRTKHHASKRVTREEFEKIYSSLVETVGPNPYGGTIFFHESYIELLAIRNMQKKGRFVGSIYDCFFYDDMTEAEVEECIASAAREYYDEIFKPRQAELFQERRPAFSGLLSRKVEIL